MWIKIEINVEVWGEKMLVELAQIPGGAGYWRLHIDRKYWGCFVDYNGSWELRLHIIRAQRVQRGKKFKDIPASPPWWFTMADIRILEDMVEEKLPAVSRRQVDFVHLLSFTGVKKLVIGPNDDP